VLILKVSLHQGQKLLGVSLFVEYAKEDFSRKEEGFYTYFNDVEVEDWRESVKCIVTSVLFAFGWGRFPHSWR